MRLVRTDSFNWMLSLKRQIDLPKLAREVVTYISVRLDGGFAALLVSHAHNDKERISYSAQRLSRYEREGLTYNGIE